MMVVSIYPRSSALISVDIVYLFVMHEDEPKLLYGVLHKYIGKCVS